MEEDRRGPGPWIGWAFVVASAVCLVAAANSWHVWRSVHSTDPGSLYDDHLEARTVFWLTWAAIAALAAGVVWAVRRWGRRDDDGPTDHTALSGAGAPATSSTAGAGAGVVDVSPATHLDWKAPTAPRPLHWTDRLRWALGAGWVGLLLVAVFAGTRMSTFDDARSAVAAGAVREVTVAGELSAAGQGTTTQEVLWRDGWFEHRAEVTAVSSSAAASAGDPAAPAGADGVPLLARDAADVLRDAQPGLVVHRTDAWSLPSTFLGWYLPAPQVFGPVLLAGALVLLLLVLNVPPTWRLTRWGWFWVGFTPVGAVLFALFAGPTPGLPRPRHPDERIGGVVAFVVSLVAGSLLHWGSR